MCVCVCVCVTGMESGIWNLQDDALLKGSKAGMLADVQVRQLDLTVHAQSFPTQ